MRRLLLIAAIGVIATHALAGPLTMPIKGVRHAGYDLATGTMVPAGMMERRGESVWGAVTGDSYYVQMLYGLGTWFAAASSTRASAQMDAIRSLFAPWPPKWACCHARTAQDCSPEARHKPSRSAPWAPLATCSSWTT